MGFWTTAAPLLFSTGIGAVAGYFIFSLRIDMRLLHRRAVTRGELDNKLALLASEFDLLKSSLATAPARFEPPPAFPGGETASLQLNRRGQVLRLHGKGQSVEEIASCLQISQGEVELLVKVHDLTPHRKRNANKSEGL